MNTVVKVTWTWSLSQNILLYTLKVFLIVTKHSPHTVAVTLAACGVTAEHKFLLLPSSQLHKKIHSYHSFSHLSIWFLSLSLYSWALSLFTERKPFRASLWKNPICQHHYSCTLGPLQEKGGWKSLALQQWTVDLLTETKWLRAGEAGTGQSHTGWDRTGRHEAQNSPKLKLMSCLFLKLPICYFRNTVDCGSLKLRKVKPWIRRNDCTFIFS